MDGNPHNLTQTRRSPVTLFENVDYRSGEVLNIEVTISNSTYYNVVRHRLEVMQEQTLVLSYKDNPSTARVEPGTPLLKEYVHPRLGSTFSKEDALVLGNYTESDIGKESCVRIFYLAQTQKACTTVPPQGPEIEGKLYIVLCPKLAEFIKVKFN